MSQCSPLAVRPRERNQPTGDVGVVLQRRRSDRQLPCPVAGSRAVCRARTSTDPSQSSSERRPATPRAGASNCSPPGRCDARTSAESARPFHPARRFSSRGSSRPARTSSSFRRVETSRAAASSTDMPAARATSALDSAAWTGRYPWLDARGSFESPCGGDHPGVPPRPARARGRSRRTGSSRPPRPRHRPRTGSRRARHRATRARAP